MFPPEGIAASAGCHEAAISTRRSSPDDIMPTQRSENRSSRITTLTNRPRRINCSLLIRPRHQRRLMRRAILFAVVLMMGRHVIRAQGTIVEDTPAESTGADGGVSG